LSLALILTMWSLLAVGLASLGLFRWWTVVLAGLVACASGWASWRARSPVPSFEWREKAFLVLLLVVGLVLFARPAERFLQIGDASIYPNTASQLIDTGGLAYHYGPLDGLSPEQNELFYIPSDEQLPGINIQSYEGLLYGAYYVMDPAQNIIVSSRPPLAIAWMGLFGLLGGPRGMLYVAPLFGVASLFVVYFLGKRLFDAGGGALAALLLLLSFPQSHFSRAPYAEMVGQFFVLTALYALVAYLQTAHLPHILLGVGALTAGFAARLDVLLFTPVLLLFVFLLILRRDSRAVMVCTASAAAGLAFTMWTVNRPYVGATGELLLRGQLRFLRHMDPYLLVGAGLVGILGLMGWRVLVGRVPPHWRHRLIGWGVLLIVVVGVGYALYVRPQRPEYMRVGGEMIASHNEEVMVIAAQYMSHPFFWLAGLGMILLFWQRQVDHDQLLFAFFVTFFAAGFLWKYTTVRIYPVALRRLVPEVLPGCALLAAFALRRMAERGRHWRLGAAAGAGLVFVLLVSLSAPYWFHRGARGAWRTLEEMDSYLPSDSVALFEPREGGAIVGWFAAPLWSFYQRDALLLNTGDVDAEALKAALCHWHDQGRAVYIISQQDPSNWWPHDFRGHQEAEIPWRSSIVGESLRFPPYIWRFSFAFSVYRLEAPVSCSIDGGRSATMLAAPPGACYNRP
jgi:hypothetical protein